LLSLKFLSFDFFGLFLEDGFNEDSSVFELVTFGCKVKFVVKSTVDFLGFSVLSKKSSQDTLSPHPKDFSGHSALTSTFAFTCSSVVTSSFRLEMKSGSGTRMDFLLTLHNKSVLDKFTHKDTAVGLANLLDFVGIHPNSLFSALKHLRCYPLLTLQTHHNLCIIFLIFYK
jgi:hypothetical protein